MLLKDGKASGVAVERDGVKQVLNCRREVIVCAGAVQSPQVLLLSGIGAGDDLQKLGIPVLHHLPAVGCNLHDHPSAPVMMETRNTDSYGISWRAEPRAAWNLIQYFGDEDYAELVWYYQWGVSTGVGFGCGFIGLGVGTLNPFAGLFVSLGCEAGLMA